MITQSAYTLFIMNLFLKSIAPTIEFEESTYQIREPREPDGVATLNIKVIRKGDQNRTSKVRCSTRDGSAQSGIDYYPKSRVLKFSPGEFFLPRT